MKKLAIITTHPIQYNAPFFALLHKRQQIAVKIFYTWSQAITEEKYDPGFGKKIAWDIPLLEGYEWEAIENVSKHPGSSTYQGINNPELINSIKAWEPNALLVYGWNFKSHLKVLRHFKNKLPVFFRGDSTLLQPRTSIRDIVRKIVLTYVYQHVDIALYAGKENKKYFKAFGLQERNLAFMPHAVDNKRFTGTDEEEIAALRKQFLFSEEAFVLLFAGKLDANKNIAAVCELVSEGNFPGLKLLIAGSGPLKNELKTKYQQKNNIVFAGFQNQKKIVHFYGLADVVILPSFSETWGLCLNEAMAMGRAVLATDGCGAAYDLIVQGENGFMYPSGDLLQLGNYLKMMLNDRPKVKEMGKASRVIIESYSFDHCCAVIEEEMKKLPVNDK